MKYWRVAALIWLATAVHACARDLYVNNVSGDDRFNGSAANAQGGKNGPWRTIARALRSAEKGDRINLAATEQPYRESITLQAGRPREFVVTGHA